VRKEQYNMEINREIINNSREAELQNKFQKVRIAKEKDRIARITAKITLEQKNKEILTQVKEKEEEIKQKK